MSINTAELTQQVQESRQWVDPLVNEVSRVVVGQKVLVHRLLIGLLSNGHVLLEGVPGLAKTLTVRTLANSIRTGFQRLQFTPDLLPADLIGTLIYNPRDGEFSTKLGPIFSNLILADEINRAPAKVQSALLDAGAAGHDRGADIQTPGSVFGFGHAESHRAGGHLSVA
jgi:MoxR-like ATPase